MKILVSYISSRYDLSETIKKIDSSIADGIHVDLMDGIYVHQSNSLPNLENISKPIDIHLMVDNPKNYFAKLLKLNPVCIYIHPSTTNNFYDDYEYLKSNNIGLGVAINPNEDIAVFEKYFPYVKRVLLMSVYPGLGGQAFIKNTKDRLTELKNFKDKYDFDIYIDGGINAETIKDVDSADGVVSGSFICLSENYDEQIRKLKENRL